MSQPSERASASSRVAGAGSGPASPGASPRRGRALLAAVLLASLSARLVIGLVLYPPDLDEQSRWYWHRTSDYLEIARHLAAGEGYTYEGGPTGILTPGVPLLLAGQILLFGECAAAIVALLAVIGAATTLAVYALGRSVFGAGAGLAAAALHALHPYLARLEVGVGEAAPYALCLALLVLCLLRAERRGRLADHVLAGAVLGVAFLVRPTVGAFAPLAAIWLVCAAKDRLRALGRVAAMAAVSLAVVSPWVVRNHHVFDRWILTRTNGGQNLWFGNNEHFEAVYPGYTLDALKPVLRQKWSDSGRSAGAGVQGRLTRQDYYAELAKAHIRADPARFARRFALKLRELYTWELSPRHETFPRIRLVDGDLRISAKPVPRPLSERLGHAVPHVFLLLFAFVGLLSSRGRMRQVWPMLLLLLANAAVCGVYFGTTKNRAPTDVFLATLAGFGVVRLFGKLGRKRPGVC